MEFMPRYAPVVVLLFLGASFVLGLTLLVVGYGLVRRKGAVIKYGLAAALAEAGLYAALLLAVSLASEEKVLGPGELKYFCEIDCHVAYSVVDVTLTKSLGTPPQARAAAGSFMIVKVKTWFDAATISSHRGNAPLTPNPRRVTLMDEQGRRYEPSAEAQRAFEQVQGITAPLTQALRPGESYTTGLMFDLPADARNPRLLITDADCVTWFLIGHEGSPLHKKIFFALPSPTKPAARTLRNSAPRGCSRR